MRLTVLLVSLVLLLGAPAFAQQMGEGRAAQMPPVQITGAVQSFSGGEYLVVKPANDSAVWITVPADVQVDRSQLKQGVSVTVEAVKINTGYLATAVTIQK